MTNSRYRYTGPLTGVTLRGGREVMLCPGAVLELPSRHPYVARLIARGLLTVEKLEAPRAPEKPTPTDERGEPDPWELSPASQSTAQNESTWSNASKKNKTRNSNVKPSEER